MKFLPGNHPNSHHLFRLGNPQMVHLPNLLISRHYNRRISLQRSNHHNNLLCSHLCIHLLNLIVSLPRNHHANHLHSLVSSQQTNLQHSHPKYHQTNRLRFRLSSLQLSHHDSLVYSHLVDRLSSHTIDRPFSLLDSRIPVRLTNLPLNQRHVQP